MSADRGTPPEAPPLTDAEIEAENAAQWLNRCADGRELHHNAESDRYDMRVTADELVRNARASAAEIARLGGRVEQLEGALRDVMADPFRAIDHAYRAAPRESFADIIVEKPHRTGCWRCRVEELLGEHVPNASERYRALLVSPVEPPT